MQNFSQFKGGPWPKWPNGKYANGRWMIFGRRRSKMLG